MQINASRKLPSPSDRSMVAAADSRDLHPHPRAWLRSRRIAKARPDTRPNALAAPVLRKANDVAYFGCVEGESTARINEDCVALARYTDFPVEV